MTWGLAADPRGFVHEAACYGSDDEFLAIVIPFLTAGAAAREPTMAAVGTRSAELMRAALGDTAGISFLDAHYLRPASAIRCHGTPPVRLRLWSGRDRTVAAVTDRGRGPADPFAGLLPADSSPDGAGLWLAHQMCGHVTLGCDDDGFTIHLAAAPAAAASSRSDEG